MATWDDFNKTFGEKKPSPGWDAFNEANKQKIIQMEAISQKEVDPALFKKLKQQDISTQEISSALAPEESPGFFKEFGSVSKKTISGLYQQSKQSLMATAQVAATPFAAAFALVPGGATPKEAAKESLKRAKDIAIGKEETEGPLGTIIRGSRAASVALSAPIGYVAASPLQKLIDPYQTQEPVSGKDVFNEAISMSKEMLTNPDVPVEQPVEEAMQMWLKNRNVGYYGGTDKETGEYKGNDPDFFDAAALTFLATFEFFGDPTLELGGGLKAMKAIKEFGAFKKLGKVEKALAKDTKIIKGTETPFEFKLSDDVKIKVQPKENSIVFEGYKKRFPSKSLDEGKMPKDAVDLIMETRRASGEEIIAKFDGDDLILKAKGKIGSATPKKPAAMVKSMSVEKLSTAKNAIKDVATETKPGAIDRAIKEIQEGTAKPIRVRTLEDGTLFIEDGRHRLEALKQLGIDDVKVEDVTSFYEPKVVEKIQKPIGAGEEKISKLSLGVEQNAVEKKLTQGLSDLPGYKQLNMKEQADLAVSYIQKNPKAALEVATGQRVPPSDILPESIFTAVENRALKTGDIATLQRLARSELATEATAMGQRIRALGERAGNSPVKVIRNIENTRLEKIRGGKKKMTAEQKRLQREIRAVKKSEKDLEEFIDSIIC